MTRHHILAVDDDKRLRALLARYLKDRGLIVNTAENTLQADEVRKLFVVDLIVLDLMMPGEDGLTYLKRLRGSGVATPVIMLTAMGETNDRIAGLEGGADDYLPKPFEPKELLLRINGLLKRASPAAPDEARFAGFAYGFATGRLTKDGRKIPLSLMEKTLLEALLKASGEPVSREYLTGLTAGNAGARAVDVQIARMRKKLGSPDIIKTVRFKGYAIDAV